MYRYCFLLLSAILLSGCQNKHNNVQAMKYHDDGHAKPIVTIVPVLDSSSYEIPWSLSNEFTSLVKDKLGRQGDIYLKNDQNVQLSNDNSPFGININWVKKSFKPSEFVVFLELTQHEDIPISSTVKDPSKISEAYKAAVNLNMSMRIRILDIRNDNPIIVLQEVIKDNYYLPNNIMERVDYNATKWGSEEYKTSPMAIAHAQFSKHIIERINDYVMLTKSR
jgi:hypothetical protein